MGRYVNFNVSHMNCNLLLSPGRISPALKFGLMFKTALALKAAGMLELQAKALITALYRYTQSPGYMWTFL